MEELLKQYKDDLEKTVNQIELLNKQKLHIDQTLKQLAGLANKQSGAVEALTKLKL
jgi:hypothetical protein